MISCKLQGGLGNQMFQIAATYAHSLRYGLECSFDLKKCYTPNQGNESIEYKNSIFSKVNDFVPTGITKQYNEPKFSYCEIPEMDNTLLIGYFQSEKYFIEYKKEISNLFSIPYDYKDVVIKHLESIGVSFDRPTTSVHIRRGDYLRLSDFHSPCSVEYYTKSISEIEAKYILKNNTQNHSQYLFISDDIEWVKNNFKGSNYFFPELNSDILDLTLQTICENNVISNSSFSWWGAWLNPNINKMVIAPIQWFGPSGHKDTQDIIPNNWIKH